MKIVYVAEDVHKHAGVPRCVAELVERMTLDNEVVVISRCLFDIQKEGVRFYRIPTLGTYFFRSITFLLAANLVLAYLVYIRRERFDIIHSTASDGGCFANIVTFISVLKRGSNGSDTGYGACQYAGITFSEPCIISRIAI